MKNQWYDITDVDLFVLSTRVLVYGAFGEKTKNDITEIKLDVTDLRLDEQEELNQCLSQSESMVIANQYLQKIVSKKSDKVRYRISEKSYLEFIESLNSRMVSNILQKLAADGILDSAYDSELNDFVFWTK